MLKRSPIVHALTAATLATAAPVFTAPKVKRYSTNRSTLRWHRHDRLRKKHRAVIGVVYDGRIVTLVKDYLPANLNDLDNRDFDRALSEALRRFLNDLCDAAK